MATNQDKSLLYIFGGLAAYFAVIRPLLESLGIVKTSEEQRQSSYEETEKNKYLDPGTEKPTKSPGEWVIIADQIYQDLKFSRISDNRADAGYQVARVKNTADFKLLYKAFGSRQEYAFGIPTGGKKDLAQFIVDNLERDQINIINKNYRLKGIKFQF
jgi:hypothetical protein